MTANTKSTSQNRAAGPLRDTVADFFAGKRFSLLLPCIAAVLFVLFPLYNNSTYWIRELSLISVLAMVVSGVNLSFGYAGEVQFGQVFMFALGAYLPMVLAIHGFDDVIILMIIGGLAAALVGFVVALPAIRIGGWSLAMASFFLVITIPDLVAIFQKWTGGLNGLVGVPNPDLFGRSIGTTALFYVTAIVTVLWLACYRNLVTSRYGVVFRALRESPVLARSLGFSTTRLKTVTYSLGALPAGIAGCLFGYISLIVQPGSFGLTLAIGVVAASVLGGIESVYGCAIGAAVLQLGPEKSLDFANYAPVAYGLFLLVAAVALRKGLGGLGLQLSGKVADLIRGSHSNVHTMANPVETLEARRVLRDERRLAYVEKTKSDGGDVSHRQLTVEGISKHYGGVQALRDVSLTAEPGCVTALIGSNGSGKTSLLNVICGYSKPDGGVVRFNGIDLTTLPSHRIALEGVGRTFQTPIIPRGVTVLDVVASGLYGSEPVGFVASIFRLPRHHAMRKADHAAALALLGMIGLEDIADDDAASLPLGTRRLAEVARSLCGNPGLLLLDEPASGLSDEEVERLGELVTDIARSGATVVLIEHNFEFVTRVAETIHVLHLGELIASGPAAAVATDPRVIASYLGESSDESEAEHIHLSGAVERSEDKDLAESGFLTVDAVESGYGDLRVLRGVSLSVDRGAVEVVLGRNGVGKTTLLSTVAGQIPAWQGSVSLGGEDLKGQASYRRAKSGIAYVQEGKRVFRNRTIWQNVMVGTYSLKLSRAQRVELCHKIISDFPMLESRISQHAAGLSGGQQQMLAIAQALASQPRILLLDEPSAGLAPSIVSEVFGQVRRLADEGLTVLLVEQLAQKALAIADHVTVLNNGRVVATGLPGDFDIDELQEAYFGE
jgi:branched-chain amino acid transport system permease protein